MQDPQDVPIRLDGIACQRRHEEAKRGVRPIVAKRSENRDPET